MVLINALQLHISCGAQGRVPETELRNPNFPVLSLRTEWLHANCSLCMVLDPWKQGWDGIREPQGSTSGEGKELHQMALRVWVQSPDGAALPWALSREGEFKNVLRTVGNAYD